MKKVLSKVLLAVLSSLMATTIVSAQNTMDVSNFSKKENDLMARVTKPVRDLDEGKLCALIRVVTDLTELEFRADALGIVQQERHNGEYWLYVPYGAKSISFLHQGYFSLVYQYALPIEEGTVYELQLRRMVGSMEGVPQNANTQMFILTHHPDNASVYVDEMEVPSENGVFAAMMSKGSHSYKVVAEQYEEAEGTFMLDDQPLRETINLQPLFGTFKLYTLPENGFDVSINGRKVGLSPYVSERMEPGQYRVRISKEDYYPIDTLIRLREGDNLLLTCKATSFADSLFYNRQLGGHRISFGVNVGYVNPFISSTSGGGFTGSLINYSLGDSRENVSYTEQYGFTTGLLADIKLYKNFYLTTGVNYSQYKYKNMFTKNIDDYVARTINELAYVGNMSNNYKEHYTLHSLDVPLLASYRFVLTKTSSLHVDMGPYVSYIISAQMKFSGTSEIVGNMFRVVHDQINKSISYGDYEQSYHYEGQVDMLSDKQSLVQTYEGNSSIGSSERRDYNLKSAPLKQLNYGIKIGTGYELRGFQLNVCYSMQLSNMANEDFWKSTRMPVFNNRTGGNVMSGYKHQIHTLEVKLAYILRY